MIVSGLVGMVALTLVAVRLVLLPGFAALERREAVEDVARGHEALAAKVSALDKQTGDWANWTDNYRFVLGQNPAFAREASETSFSELGINVNAIVDRSGRVLLGRAFDLHERKWTMFPSALVKDVFRHPTFISNLSPESRLAGVVMLPSGPVLIVARPVLTTEGRGPVHGILIFGRYLDSFEVGDLSSRLHLPVSVVGASVAADSQSPSLLPNTNWTDRAAVISITGNTLAGDVSIADIMGRPAFTLRLTIPRDIYDHGRLTALYFLGTVSGLGLTLGVILLAIFQRLESARIGQQEAELRYRAIITQTAEGFLVVEPRTQAILEGNPACETLLGWSASQLRTKTLREVSTSLADAAARFAATSATQTDRTPREVQYEGPPGAKLVLEVSGGSIDSDGRPITVLVLRDVTARRQAEAARLAKDAADRANQQKSEFLSRMSHELRTPLNSILGFAQLLQMQGLNQDEAQSVGQIVKAGQHLLSLINEVLDIARVEAGRVPLSMESVGVHPVLQEAVDLVAHLTIAQGCSIRYEAEAAERYVMADQQRLKQVLLNLLSNAVKYNRENGTVTVACENRPDKTLRIKVADTGYGIPSEKMLDLFTPFARLGADKTHIEGTGLGLTLSKRLVDAMGGRIGVESVVNEGTTFWVDLPYAESSAIPSAQAEEPSGSSPRLLEIPKTQTGGHRSVLYIEDNPANLRLIRDIAAFRPEIKLITALRGRLGLDLARRNLPDLILLDLELPDISGLEILTELKAQPRTRQIPVVMLTADATRDQAETLKAAGCDGYLAKPLDSAKLLEALNGTLVKIGVSRGG